MLTDPQIELLVWIIEEADGSVLYEQMLGEGDSVNPARPGPDQRGREFSMNAIDLRELEHQGLLRKGTGKLYEITNDGRLVYEQVKNPEPPAERPQVGFQPPP